MPRALRNRNDLERAASPRVGDTHRRRSCAVCYNTRLCTYMNVSRGWRSGTQWLCRNCTVRHQRMGYLRRA